MCLHALLCPSSSSGGARTLAVGFSFSRHTCITTAGPPLTPLLPPALRTDLRFFSAGPGNVLAFSCGAYLAERRLFSPRTFFFPFFFCVACLRSTAWLGKEEEREEKISFSVFTSGSPLQPASDVWAASQGPAGDVTGGVKQRQRLYLFHLAPFSDLFISFFLRSSEFLCFGSVCGPQWQRAACNHFVMSGSTLPV